MEESDVIPKTEIDQDTVEKLRKSKELVGYLGDVVKDQEGTILSGRHRKLADPDWPEKEMTVTDPLQRELLILHYNVQRTVSKEETQKRLLNIAKIVESTGIPKNEICTEVTKLVPFSGAYVRELLPDQYKMMSKTREFAQPVAQTVHEKMDATLGRTKEAGEKLTRKVTGWVRCEGEGCNILTKPTRIHEGKVLCSRCYAKALAEPEPPQKPVRTFDITEPSQERQIPESEPKPKWRTTITMKKPYTTEWPTKPNSNTVLEEFADAIADSRIDDFFDIKIEETAEQ